MNVNIDLYLRALPHVSAAMPEQASRAMPLLEQALALEGDYAVAHGLLALCHQTLWRAGFKQDNRIAAIRHARAAVTHGRDDAMALALGAFVIGMVEHDRAAALDAFERAQTLSPSSALALFMGGIVQAYAGNAERAMEWAERPLRISPIDRLSYVPHHVLAIGHFLQGQYNEAARRRAVQANPEFSVSQSPGSSLAELGQVEAAKVAAMQVMALQPSFSSHEFCAAVGIVPALTKPLTEA
jgi:tetratricopeptide (TPR) repeat protein